MEVRLLVFQVKLFPVTLLREVVDDCETAFAEMELATLIEDVKVKEPQGVLKALVTLAEVVGFTAKFVVEDDPTCKNFYSNILSFSFILPPKRPPPKRHHQKRQKGEKVASTICNFTQVRSVVRRHSKGMLQKSRGNQTRLFKLWAQSQLGMK